ncbi:GNAT family N-acetyltransferase [Planococcus shixiaomingii]|uniref:GNAT family N-acetyltransferase n=1 Tax=Planococcus shixiaomingii TaxID=3058393 RepID=UPI002609BD40|nr:GNAT family N-acetyltransferase [Planococcus sp. N022]WKA56570.1 GNAT family N-acetyltransferase [Planococcus sp. N022]
MNYKVIIKMPISNNEVPELRQLIGWERRETDYPILFQRCNFWEGVRDENKKLIAFGYVCGMGLERGYLEDIMVHPNYQKQGIGVELVKGLIQESERFGLSIVTTTFEERHANFYRACGFKVGSGGVWLSSLAID